MRINEVLISNFLSIENITLYFNDSHAGLNVIEGINKDESSTQSNGAGKSALFDAICWGLFGLTPRGIRGKEIIKRGERTAEVIVVFEINNLRYSISRCIGKANELTFYQIDVYNAWIILTQGTQALTQAKINEVLKFDYELFKSVVYMGQDNLPDFPSLTDKGLKTFMERILKLTEYADAYEYAKKHFDNSKQVVLTLEQKVEMLEKQLAEKNAEVEKMKWDELTWSKDRMDRLTEAAVLLKKLKDEVDGLKYITGNTSKDYKKLLDVYQENRSECLQIISKVCNLQTNVDVNNIDINKINADIQQLTLNLRCCKTCGEPFVDGLDLENIYRSVKDLEDKKNDLVWRNDNMLTKINELLDGRPYEHYTELAQDLKCEIDKLMAEEIVHSRNFAKLKAAEEKLELQKKTLLSLGMSPTLLSMLCPG